MKVLVVDDEVMIVEFLKRALSVDGHLVDYAYNGAIGVQKAVEKSFDAIILDVLMPEIDGIEACRQIRTAGLSVPILILSTKQSTEDRVNGLDSGADDYLIKPFTYDELAARLRALLRRPREVLPATVTFEDILIDPAKRAITRQNYEIELTQREFSLLEYLCMHPHRAVSREELLTKIWGATRRNSSNRIEVCIKGLRNKIDEPGKKSIIQTVRGFGYMLRKAT